MGVSTCVFSHVLRVAVVWQFMQYSSLATLRAQAGGAAVFEGDLVKWANEKVYKSINR